MSTSMVRIQEEDKDIIQKIAKESHQSMLKVMHQAIEEYRRKLFLQKSNLAFSVLKEKPVEWKNYKKEREEWDSTLNDGLEE